MYLPGDLIASTWSENIDCSAQNKQLRVVLKVEGSGTEYTPENGGLLVVCERRTIFLSLPPSVPYDALSGRQMEVHLSGVADYVGNVQPQKVSWAFAVQRLQLQEAQVLIHDLLLDNVEAPDDMALDRYIQSALPTRLAAALGEPASLFKVLDVTSMSAKRVSVDMQILGNENTTPTALAARVHQYLSNPPASNCEPACSPASPPEITVSAAASTAVSEASGSGAASNSDCAAPALTYVILALAAIAVILLIGVLIMLSRSDRSGRVVLPAPPAALSHRSEFNATYAFTETENI